VAPSQTRPSRPRRRRSAPETRKAILEAAQKRLIEGGPDALRLQDIASVLGISHPAIRHHFGSREGLLQALVRRALGALQDELLAALDRPADKPAATAERLLERVFETLGDRGHARLLAWMALSGRGEPAPGEAPPPPMLRELAEVMHGRRAERARAAGSPEPDPEDTLFAVILVAVALTGEAVLGDGVRRSAGLAQNATARRRFRAWLGRLLVAHLSGPGSPAPSGPPEEPQ